MSAPQSTVLKIEDIGVPGQLANFQSAADAVVDSKFSEEASASIAFGLMVKEGTADKGVKLMTAANNKLAGIVVWAENFHTPSEIDANGLRPGCSFGCLSEGDIIVTSEAAVTPASGVHVRFTANGGNTVIGAFTGTADATHTIDISPFARWLTSCGAAGKAVLRLNLANAALAVAD